jgi:hypothetical protein
MGEIKTHHEIEIKEQHVVKSQRNQLNPDEQNELVVQEELPPVDAAVFKHGALLAQNPRSFDEIPGLRLSRLERRALERDLPEEYGTDQNSTTYNASRSIWPWPLWHLKSGIQTVINDIDSAWKHFKHTTGPFKIVLSTCCLAAITQGL